MTSLRAGVIGVGHLGQHHARHYATLPGVTLAGVYDASPDRAKLIAERHSVPAWTDLTEVLKQVDAVLVMSVDGRAHLEQIKLVLKAGKPVWPWRQDLVSKRGDNGLRTIVNMQFVGSTRYFDAAGFAGRTVGLKAPASAR